MTGLSAAESLSGLTLEGGWIVGDRIDPPGGTGGCFSVRYHVRSTDGEDAFLKALDISSTWGSTTDFVAALQKLLRDYEFERGLVEKCTGMSRVVRGLAFGQAIVPNSVVGPVPYLIFELANGGDVRRYLGSVENAHDVAWKLSALHHVATGLDQLHRQGIAHQDLKPSNVLVFENNIRKIGDLGCASERGNPGPRDGLLFAGDPNYPPLEVFYGYQFTDWDEQRFGYDLYLLGSMVVFFFTQQSMSALLLRHLNERFYPQTWTGTFLELLPYLQNAFSSALAEFKATISDERLGTELSDVVRQLCNPDPAARGCKDYKRGSRFALEKFISRFDLLSKRAMIRARAA